MDDPLIIQPLQFTLDDKPIDLVDFLEDNQFEESVVDEIFALPINYTMSLGGGASPIRILKRIN